MKRIRSIQFKVFICLFISFMVVFGYIVKTKYRGVKMSIEKVKEYFAEYGREDDILEFDKSSATVELAAQAANVIPARIAKTLSLKIKKETMLF